MKALAAASTDVTLLVSLCCQQMPTRLPEYSGSENARVEFLKALLLLTGMTFANIELLIPSCAFAEIAGAEASVLSGYLHRMEDAQTGHEARMPPVKH